MSMKGTLYTVQYILSILNTKLIVNTIVST
jgi:hypothetical protein